jgi:hypothetical protein
MPAHNTMIGGSFGAQSPMSGYPQTQVPTQAQNALGIGGGVIDGTPMRVVTIVAIAVGGVIGLRYAGFKFNVTAGV